MSRAYYNEFDPKAAAWLRELIKEGHIAPGDVDERSITDVHPSDLANYDQCHFFAGIGGWSYALRLAGVPDSRPIWTGSCPCQPFSAAGKQLGTADERHLWPVMRELMRACRPAIALGEQVASKAGRLWLAGVFADLEGMAYRRAAADLCAASVGAPHIRQRLFWMAYAGRAGDECRLRPAEAFSATCPTKGEAWERERSRSNTGGGGRYGGLEDTLREGRSGQSLGLLGAGDQGDWSNFDLLPCLDGKTRRVESGTFPLAHGVPGRVGLLRGYGNAIVPQVAAEFVAAALEAIQCN